MLNWPASIQKPALAVPITLPRKLFLIEKNPPIGAGRASPNLSRVGRRIYSIGFIPASWWLSCRLGDVYCRCLRLLYAHLAANHYCLGICHPGRYIAIRGVTGSTTASIVINIIQLVSLITFSIHGYHVPCQESIRRFGRQLVSPCSYFYHPAAQPGRSALSVHYSDPDLGRFRILHCLRR